MTDDSEKIFHNVPVEVVWKLVRDFDNRSHSPGKVLRISWFQDADGTYTVSLDFRRIVTHIRMPDGMVRRLVDSVRYEDALELLEP